MSSTHANFNLKRMENLLLPSKVEFLAGQTPHTGVVVIAPCFHGYGTTLGNAYRRVLLSSLPGAAVESFKIKGVQHEFSAASGVGEDVVEIMLNLKQLSVKMYSEDPITLVIEKKGPGVVTAADIQKNAQVEVINTDLVIANLTTNKPFEMELVVGRGRGFKTAEQKDRRNFDLGMIAIDSIYTPVKDVGYSVEYTRVGDTTDYEKLSINIETNGTITPEDAIEQATKILMDHFEIVRNAKSSFGAAPIVEQVSDEVVEVSTVEEEVVGETDETGETKPKKEAKVKKEKKAKK